MNAPPSSYSLAQIPVQARRELLAKVLREKAEQSDPVPLSFSQERLWFLDKLAPRQGLYHLPLVLKMRGVLHVPALRRALQEIVNRHEILRTTFSGERDDLVQVISDSLHLDVPISDLSEMAGAARDAEVNLRIRQTIRDRFELDRGPLLRARLLRVARDEHWLVLVLHHIICDAWSLEILLREFSTLYAAFSKGCHSPLADLPIQYADFAVWQRERMQNGMLEAQLAHWRERLKGVSQVIELPGDHPRPSLPTFQGAHQSFLLPSDVSGALKQLSQKEGATLFMTLLALFNVLLHRYTAHDDIVVGVPIANRSRREIEPLIGFVANTLALRTPVRGEWPFREFLSRVRRVALEAYEHQDLPFDKLVEKLRPERSLSHNPIFQVMMVFQPATSLPERGRPDRTPIDTFESAGLSVTPVEVHTGTAKFDLTVLFRDTGDSIAGDIEFNTDIFESETVSRMISHFQILARQVAANPGGRIRELPILSDAERHRVVVEWNQTAHAYDRDRCLHHLFEAQAKRTPDAEAVVGHQTRLSYAELDDQANRLARLLRSSGVGPETLVGLCLKPSVGLVIGMLGILKAGGAYVPLDPTHPPARLAFALSDSRAKVVVTETKLLNFLPPQFTRDLQRGGTGDSTVPVGDPPTGMSGALSSNSASTAVKDALAVPSGEPPNGTGGSPVLPKEIFQNTYSARVICLDVLDGGPAQPMADRPGESPEMNRLAFIPRPEALAYVIYTSGSTGQPKGVGVEHRNAVALVEWARNTYSPDELKGVLASTSVCFDLSVFEVFVPLSCGGKVILADNLLQLPELAAAGEVTLINTVPSAMAELLRMRAVPESVRTVNLAGEPLSLKLVREIRQNTRARRVFDLYGPTEDAVYSTAALRQPDGIVTIGRPLSNKQVYVLDGQLQPVPAGVPGELFIGGDGVSRGYLNRPELTSEKFVPNPFGERPGARLYRTGDRARFLPGGNIEFLGRMDHQVKLRGYRIELGEIEAALCQHPSVGECVVTLTELNTDEKALIGYVVVEGNTSLDDSALRRFLAQQLPDYMVPSAWVVLEALPRTPTGKVDRRALPLANPFLPRPKESRLTPRTATERTLSDIWGTVLGVDGIGVEDNFFELGGHSLLATRVIARVRAELGLDVPMRFLFESPTIAALAIQIEAMRPPDSPPHVCHL